MHCYSTYLDPTHFIQAKFDQLDQNLFINLNHFDLPTEPTSPFNTINCKTKLEENALLLNITKVKMVLRTNRQAELLLTVTRGM